MDSSFYEVDGRKVAQPQGPQVQTFRGLELDPMDDAAKAAYDSLGRASNDPNCNDNPGFISDTKGSCYHYTLPSPSVELCTKDGKSATIHFDSLGDVKGVRIIGEYLYAVCQKGGLQINVLRDVRYSLPLTSPFLQELDFMELRGKHFERVECPLTLTLNDDQLHFLQTLVDQHVGTDALKQELQSLNPVAIEWMKRNDTSISRDSTKRGCYFKGKKLPLIILLGCEWETGE